MRIYCPTLPSSGEVNLPQDEAMHAIKVMRLRVGDLVELFDGLGASASAKIVHIEKNRCLVGIDHYSVTHSTSSSKLIVGVGLPKGDRQRSVIERATELGVDELVPIECEFGVAVATDNAIDRARRTVIESCKQSGRNRLMEIGEPTRCDEWFSLKSTAGSQHVLRLICHPGVEDSVSFAELVKRQFGEMEHSPTNETLAISTQLAIGPEGGFSDRELANAIENSWQVLDLGPHILRVETALTAAVTLAKLVSELRESADPR